MKKFNVEKILERAEDVGVLSRVVYSPDDPRSCSNPRLYKDEEFTVEVGSEELFELFKRGLMIAYTDGENNYIGKVTAFSDFGDTTSIAVGPDLASTEVIEAPAENDNLLIVSEGAVKQVPAANFAASSGGGVEPIYVVYVSTMNFEGDYVHCTMEDGSALPTNLYDLYKAGTPIIVLDEHDIQGYVYPVVYAYHNSSSTEPEYSKFYYCCPGKSYNYRYFRVTEE